MKIITFNNTKLGGNIPQINMPVGLSCRENPPCANVCYAANGQQALFKVKAAHRKRFEMYQQDPVGFFKELECELTGWHRYPLVRYHSSGDIPDSQYFSLMNVLARRVPDTRFLCFTKKHEIVNAYIARGGEIAPNLSVVLSAFARWVPDNPYNLPMAWVRFPGDAPCNQLIPADAFQCSGGCYQCENTHCWFMKPGDHVVFNKHGHGKIDESLTQ